MLSSGEKMLPYPPRPMTVDQRWKPNVEIAPNCPRCDSSNTKFCYYNNYSLRQPRYFCKGCRRYWTKGGSLRNIPVGGGCRKNRTKKPIRVSSERVGSGDLNYSRQPPNSLRPDLVLEDLVGNRSDMVSSMDMSDGSSIDLALLYTKFLNPHPDHESGLIDECFDLMGLSNSDHQMHTQLSQNQCVVVECQRPSDPIEEVLSNNGNQTSMGEIDFSLDPSGYGSQVFPASGEVDDIFWSDCLPNSMSEARKYQGFEEDSMSTPNQNLIIGDWSTFDQSSFAAFTRS